MGSPSHHTAQEGDAICLLEINVLMQKVQKNPRTTAKRKCPISIYPERLLSKEEAPALKLP